MVTRRQFLRYLAAGSAGYALSAALPPRRIIAQSSPSSPTTPAGPRLAAHAWLPRWRGFNLLEKFYRNDPYQEWDFDFLARWGFDFVRLPTDYRIWTISTSGYREEPLKDIDRAIEWARARRIHVNLALHGAPGYRRNRPEELLNLWAEGEAGEVARRQFALQWRMFAARYRGIPGYELSFNLVNEPPDIPGERYFRVAAAAVEAIRAEDPGRLIIADGAN